MNAPEILFFVPSSFITSPLWFLSIQSSNSSAEGLLLIFLIEEKVDAMKDFFTEASFRIHDEGEVLALFRGVFKPFVWGNDVPCLIEEKVGDINRLIADPEK
jgi:hypothetical protein